MLDQPSSGLCCRMCTYIRW